MLCVFFEMDRELQIPSGTRCRIVGKKINEKVVVAGREEHFYLQCYAVYKVD